MVVDIIAVRSRHHWWWWTGPPQPVRDTPWMAYFVIAVVVVFCAADQGVEVLERPHFGTAIALLMKEVSSEVSMYG